MIALLYGGSTGISRGTADQYRPRHISGAFHCWAMFARILGRSPAWVNDVLATIYVMDSYGRPAEANYQPDRARPEEGA